VARRYVKSGSEASERNAPQYFTSRRPPRRSRHTVLGRHINDRRGDMGSADTFGGTQMSSSRRAEIYVGRSGSPGVKYHRLTGKILDDDDDDDDDDERRRFRSLRRFRPGTRGEVQRRARHASCHLPYLCAFAGHKEGPRLSLFPGGSDDLHRLPRVARAPQSFRSVTCAGIQFRERAPVPHAPPEFVWHET